MISSRVFVRGSVIGLMFALAAVVLIACGDDNGGGTGSVSGSASASGEPVGPGVVSAKPANAAQVDVVLREWSITPAPTSVAAGQIYFLVDNQGPEDPHEFVVIRTDLAPGSLPFENNEVPEDKINLIGEIEPFTPRSKASAVFNLTAGNYVLICNITELEGGQVESHYREGMRVAFRVQ
jgi:uncharacterized cupredoxin-like copper-binding protein